MLMNSAMKFSVTRSEPKKFQEENFFGLDFDGVYLVGYRDTATDKRHVVYVGQGNVGTRLADHFRNHTRIKARVCLSGCVGYYRFARCADKEVRLDIELGLYRNHGAKSLCNELEPCGSGTCGEIVVSEVFS